MIKRILKHLIYEVLYGSLVFLFIDKLLRAFSKHRKLIVFFHGVSATNPFSINGRHLPVKDFESLLRYFSTNFNVIPLHELCSGINPQKGPFSHSIALTFDDGFKNNITVALPILEKYGLPATFFVCSKAMDDPLYLHPSDLLDLVKMKANQHPVVFNQDTFIEKKGQLINVRDGRTMYACLASLSQDELLKGLESFGISEERSGLVEGIDPELYELMTRHDLDNVLKHPLITIGSHAHAHFNLRRLTNPQVKTQLETSKQLLERSSAAVTSIAFPYGQFNETIVKLARGSGYRYLLAGGDVEKKFSGEVFPRIGVATLPGVPSTILSINRGFGRFGF